MHIYHLEVDDLNFPTEVMLRSSANEIDVQVEVHVPDNCVFSEERRKYNVSISEIEAIDATGVCTSVEGGPIEIIVFDDDGK